jgi:DNA helicase-2/ATP-dependent DNA helicase PcrA
MELKIQDIYDALDTIPKRQIKLDDCQKKAIQFGEGPLWIIAGPGSGKTEVLVLRCLKLLCIDKINPKALILTTFTEKAARNIADRLTFYLSYLSKKYNELSDIDASQLRIGTLHKLCIRIMQEYRYKGYKNYKVLDEAAQRFFIFDRLDLCQPRVPFFDEPLWEHFSYLNRHQNPNQSNSRPYRWDRVEIASTLLDRIVEDYIDVDKLETSDHAAYRCLALAYKQYESAMETHYRCDFAYLQKKFNAFLDATIGRRFIEGDGSDEHPGIKYVLVDEYQDTNPIQEAIYFKLAGLEPHNLCVVGDDDQSLYRFRGGNVECMVNFSPVCEAKWGIPKEAVCQIPLAYNYRSHPAIVSWCSEYICSFNEMQVEGARVSGKSALEAHSTIFGDYPAAAFVNAKTRTELAKLFAEGVSSRLAAGTIKDPNQAVLLMPSVKETKARFFVEELRKHGLDAYNPRSGGITKQEEVQLALGTYIAILDPESKVQESVVGNNLNKYINSCKKRFATNISRYSDLKNYVTESISEITKARTESASCEPMEIFYHILNYEPFITWIDNPEHIERAVRLGVITEVLEAFVSTPKDEGGERRKFRTVHYKGRRGINKEQIKSLYYLFFGYLASGRLNDREDEEMICPSDRVPIMTIHQAKGLEFPFVFVCNVDREISTRSRDTSVQLEEELGEFRRTPPIACSERRNKALEDSIRKCFVAYSRAQHALILLLPENLNDDSIAIGGRGLQWFKAHVKQLNTAGIIQRRLDV